MKKYASYSEEFKQSIVNLYRNGKPSGEIFKEYGMSSTKKNDKYLRAGISKKVDIIKELSARYEIKRLCRIFCVPRSTYYVVLRRKACKRKIENEAIKGKITEIYELSGKRYGCIKIKHILEKYNIHISQNRVLRLMRQIGIRSIICKKYRKHSRNNETAERPNLLNRRFYAEKPNQVWLSDITYIKTLRQVGLIWRLF